MEKPSSGIWQSETTFRVGHVGFTIHRLEQQKKKGKKEKKPRNWLYLS